MLAPSSSNQESSVNQAYLYSCTSYRSQPRCYLTYKTNINRVCHHCGKLMSQDVEPFEMPRRISNLLYENLEYHNLNLEDFLPENSGVHCEDCKHRNHSFWWIIFWNVIIISITLIFISAIYLMEPDLPRISIVTISLRIAFSILFLALIVEYFYIFRERQNNKPHFPVIGREPKIQVQEQLIGTVILDAQGTYKEFVESPKGNLKYSVRLTPSDFNRLRKYKKIFRLSNLRGTIESAGFIIFDSEKSIKFSDIQLSNTQQANTICLARDFTQRVGDSQWIWESNNTYDIVCSSEQQLLPIQIIPTIVNEGKNQALELTVQVNKELHGCNLREIPIIKELHLFAPISLAKCKSQEPPSRKIIRQSDEWELIWNDQEIDQGKDKIFFRTFFLLFTKPVQENMEFTGSLTVRLEGAFSGIDNLKLFYPWGRLRVEKQEAFEVFRDSFTDIVITFRLTLQHAFLRKFYTLTPPRITAREVIPNYLTVIKLVELINNENIYVQRVIENPATTSLANAQTRNRYWDVAGRYYYGVYPIDFHLLITGKENYTDEELPTTGECSFEIKIHATVTTDAKLEEEVKAFERKLVAIIKQLD